MSAVDSMDAGREGQTHIQGQMVWDFTVVLRTNSMQPNLKWFIQHFGAGLTLDKRNKPQIRRDFCMCMSIKSFKKSKPLNNYNG